MAGVSLRTKTKQKKSSMNLQRPYIEDVLDVIKEIQESTRGLSNRIDIRNVRIKAVRSVARKELNRNRFSDIYSAEKSIHDACSRRLKPAVNKISDFDSAVLKLLSSDPIQIESILLSKAENSTQKADIGEIITNSRQAVSSPKAVDIQTPSETQRKKVETYRILRDTALSRNIKSMHKHQCQICGNTLFLSNHIPYAEAHHIKPLGGEHCGPDISDNIICVCPNCHVLLDYGAIALDSTQIKGMEIHKISNLFIEYHNNKIFNKINING